MNARLAGLSWSALEQAWITESIIEGKSVTVYVRRWDEPPELPDFQIDAALRAIEFVAGNGDALKHAAADALLDTFNETWREDQPVHTATDFAARMSLRTIDVEPDGERATYAYDDGNLFLGHTILVDVLLKELIVDDVSF
jgi:hypothetical protein